MNRFFLISNTTKDRDGSLAGYVKEAFQREGCICYTDSPGNEGSRGEGYTCADHIPADVECILALGGDGTLIQAARDTLHLGLPILGINRGTLGYLTEVELNKLPETIAALREDRYEIDQRMLLKGDLTGKGGKNCSSYALNDIVLARSGPLRILRFTISVNGHFLTNIESDGIIISTPTGSTGYNLSAGGPVVEPSAQMMVITPICAHSLNIRSIVLSAEDRVMIEPAYAAEDSDMLSMELFFDGKCTMGINGGDSVSIMRSPAQVRMVKLSQDSFLQVLRNKMGAGVR